MRVMLLTLSTVFALVALPAPADAQFNFSAQGALITSVDTLSSLSNAFGVGVELNLGVSLFLEANWEFHDEDPTMPDFDNNPIVIKGGITFG